MTQTFVPISDVSNAGGIRRELKHTGTAQAGSATTITLDTGASAVDDFYNGDLIELVSGTGATPGTQVTITDYVGATKVATVASWPGSNPDATTVFEIREADLYVGLASTSSSAYVESQLAPSGAAFRVNLSAGVDPNSTAQHRKYLIAWKDPSGGARMDVKDEIIGGGGLIADETFTDVPATETEVFFDLSTSEINAIAQADYEGLLDEQVTFTQV